VVSLLAVLELCRQGKIRTQQTELFGDIVIERQTEPAAQAATTASDGESPWEPGPSPAAP
jgi:chromatin segregation and condensation protein Rec8/ScpA/Scc1 (kleisin family)